MILKKKTKIKKGYFYATGLVYRLWIGRSVLICFLGTLTLTGDSANLYYIICMIGPVGMILTLRRFYFYEDYVKVKYILFNKDVLLPYKELICIKFMHRPRGSPMVIIKTPEKNYIKRQVKLSAYRFMLYDFEKVASVLRYVKQRGVRVVVDAKIYNYKKIFAGLLDE